MQLTRTLGIWLDTLHHTMNTIWYDTICILHLKLITLVFSWEVIDPGGGLPFSKNWSHNLRLPTLPTWQALLAAKRLSTLPPLWASWCHFFTNFQTFLFYNFPLCSAGAPPGANGHPVSIAYEGFNLLTDNYNNYFMSSFIPQVKIIRKSEFDKNLLSLYSSTIICPGAARPTRSNWSSFLTGCKLTNFSGGSSVIGLEIFELDLFYL